MKISLRCFVLVLGIAAGAFVLRVPLLAQRPMHGDEAVHAIKFGELLEKGEYRYDRNEYHGPVLNYLSLVPAWFSSAENLTEVNEVTLRIVPVVFGVLLILLVLLLIDGLGSGGVIIVSVLTAISPAFVFYSRYYIHEMLLVCFTFGVIVCGWRYSRSRNIWWILPAGVFVGLTHATKETCIIAFGSMVLAFLFAVWMQRGSVWGTVRSVKGWHLCAAIGVAILVSVLFYSSFFTNPVGILESLQAYGPYFSRAGQNQLHIHPWYYYIKMLVYFRLGEGPVWSEGLIVLLAVIGFVVAMKRKGELGINFELVRFIGFYTLLMVVIYSVIAYKTPWCLLGFLHGMILLAGVGVIALVKLVPKALPRVIIILLLIAGGLHLGWQGYLSSYKYYDDPANPYVYAHPLRDVIAMSRRVEEIAKVHPDGYDMAVGVVCSEYDYWPLPWYLRGFSNVGWWEEVDGDMRPVPVIIGSANLEADIMRMLYEKPPAGERKLYVPLFEETMLLRPGAELRGYVTKELLDRYQQHQMSGR